MLIRILIITAREGRRRDPTADNLLSLQIRYSNFLTLEVLPVLNSTLLSNATDFLAATNLNTSRTIVELLDFYLINASTH